MAAEYEVNIKLNTGKAETQLKNIESSVAKIGKAEKQSVDTTDRRVASMVKLRSIGDDVAALEQKGIDMSKARFQLDKAGQAINEKMFTTASARMGVATKELNVQRSITKQLEQQEKAARRQTTRRAESVALGAGFPLLFGGGPGAVIGGAVGGLTGSFGAQIALSAVGQQIDQFVAGVVEAGKAFTSVGGAADFMAEKSLFSSDAMQIRIEKLIEEGKVSEAAALMTQEMAKQVGGSGLKALKDLGDEANKMGKLFGALILQVQAFISKALTPLLAAINAVVGDIVLNNQFNALVNEATGARADEIDEFLKPFTTTVNVRGSKTKDIVSAEGKRLAVEQFGGQFIPEGAAIQPTQMELQQASAAASKEAAQQQKRLDQLEAERKKVLEISQFKDEIAAASAADNQELVIILQREQKIAEIESQRLKDLAGVTDEREKEAINIVAATKKLAAHRDEERALAELQQKRQEAFEDTIEDLDHQLDLAQAVTQEERDQLEIEREIRRLQEQYNFSDPQLEAIKARMEALREEQNLINTFIKDTQAQIEQLSDPMFQAISLATALGDAFSSSFRGIIDGSMSAQEALANFFQSIADHFLDMAAQMIAAQIEMMAMNIFMSFMPAPGVPSGFSLSSPDIGGTFGVAPITPGLGSPGAFTPGRALGGQVGAGQPYLVGERGPELFVPGAQGNIVPNNAMGGSNIVVNVDASGSSVQGDSTQATQLGKLLGAAVQTEIVKQQRPGGLLAR